ncbi:hypothetical protein [Mesorhizobium sp. A556]
MAKIKCGRYAGGDKRPEYTPDIGWSGRLTLLALVVFFALGAFGCLLV